MAASLTLVILSACAGASASDGGDGTTVTVFAASSLGAAFTRIGVDFEAAHPGTQVVLNLGASDALAAQIQSEGTADVFASASETWMDEVADDPGVRDRADFAANRLTIVTPPDDPAGVSSLQDLARPGVQVVLGAEGVPVGDYAREVLQHAGVRDAVLSNVVSNEEDNAGVVAKVAAGEADAAIVYTSDVSAAAGNDLRAVPIPGDVNVVANYPIAGVVGGHASAAADLVAYVLGPQGQATLRAYGFGPAPG